MTETDESTKSQSLRSHACCLGTEIPVRGKNYQLHDLQRKTSALMTWQRTLAHTKPSVKWKRTDVICSAKANCENVRVAEKQQELMMLMI